MKEAEMHQQDVERVKREQRELFDKIIADYVSRMGMPTRIELMAEAYLMGERNEKERVK